MCVWKLSVVVHDHVIVIFLLYYCIPVNANNYTCIITRVDNLLLIIMI